MARCSVIFGAAISCFGVHSQLRDAAFARRLLDALVVLTIVRGVGSSLTAI